MHHFECSQSLNADEVDKIYLFLKENLLRWLQAMSLLGRAPETAAMIDVLMALMQVNFRRGLFYFPDKLTSILARGRRRSPFFRE